MANKKNLTVSINAKSEVNRGINNALSSFKRMSTRISSSVSNVTSSLFNMKNALVGVFAGAAMRQVLSAYGEQELADRKLNAALRATGHSVEQYGAQLKQVASDIQQVTVFGDEFIENIMKTGLNLGVSADHLGDTTKAAIGLANALDMDLNTSMRYTVLATQGEFTMLRRYIPALRRATTETEQLAIIQKVANAGWEQAQEETKTAIGSWKQFKNSVGDILETVGGTIFMQFKDRWLDTLSRVKAAALSPEFKDAIEEVFVSIGTMLESVVKIMGSVVRAIVEIASAFSSNQGVWVAAVGTIALMNSNLAIMVAKVTAAVIGIKFLLVSMRELAAMGEHDTDLLTAGLQFKRSDEYLEVARDKFSSSLAEMNRLMDEGRQQEAEAMQAQVNQARNAIRVLEGQREGLRAYWRSTAAESERGQGVLQRNADAEAQEFVSLMDSVKSSLGDIGDAGANAARAVANARRIFAGLDVDRTSAQMGGFTLSPTGGGTDDKDGPNGAAAKNAVDAYRLIYEEKQKLLLASIEDETARKQEELRQQAEREIASFRQVAEQNQFTQEQVDDWIMTRNQRLMSDLLSVKQAADEKYFADLLAMQEEAAAKEIDLISQNSSVSLQRRIADLQDYRQRLNEKTEAYSKATEAIAALQKEQDDRYLQGLEQMAAAERQIHLDSIEDRFERERQEAQYRYDDDLEAFKGTEDQKTAYMLKAQKIRDTRLAEINAREKVQRQIDTIGQSVEDMSRQVSESMSGGLTDAIMDMERAWHDSTISMGQVWNGFLQNIGQSLFRTVFDSLSHAFIRATGVQRGLDTLFSTVFGFLGGGTPLTKGASGAVWAGGFQPIAAFANGSPFVNQPTLGLIGEGRYPEAVVPLPDGRRIPVDMRGGAGDVTYNVNIYATDFQSFANMMASPDGKAVITSTIVESNLRNGSVRRSNREVL